MALVFIRLLKDTPITTDASVTVVADPLIITTSLIGTQEIEVVADPLIITTSLIGIGGTDEMVVANPLITALTLHGNYSEVTNVTVVADPLTIVTSLIDPVVDDGSSEADPLGIEVLLLGRVKIEPDQVIPEYQIELRDSNDVLQWVFVDNIEGLSWSYLLRGGCDKASFTIRDPSLSLVEETIQGYDVQIKLNPGYGMGVWWRGFVDDARLNLGDPYTFSIDASGWFYRLERLSVVGLGFPIEDGSIIFENQDAAAIARQLVDRANDMGVGINYTGVTAPDSGFILETIQFNSSIAVALRTLAQLAGESEYGVTRRKEFYFHPTTTTVGETLLVGKNVLDFEHSSNTSDLVNRVYILGGGGYKAIVEDNDSLTEDILQLGTDSEIDFGKATSNQRVVQTFTTTRNSLSAIDIRIKKTGFTGNLVTDGDMELADGSSPTNWPKIWERVRRKKTSTFKKDGTQSLEIRHDGTGKGGYGVFQNVTVTADVDITVTGWVKDPDFEDIVKLEVIDGSLTKLVDGGHPFKDSRSSVLGEFQPLNRNSSWHKLSITVTPTGTTIGIMFYSWNRVGGTGKDRWYLDKITVQEGPDVSLAVVERTSADAVVPPVFNENNPLAIGVVDFDDITTSLATVRVIMIASPLNTTKTYGMIFSSQGALSDTQYFTLGMDASKTGLFVDDGGGWVSTAGALFHKTFLPLSQITWGVRSEVISQPHISNDADAIIWGKSVLAAKGSPKERASFSVIPNVNIMFEEDIPIRLVRVRNAE